MNLASLLTDEQLSERRNQIKNIFFYRICGTGMGACACIAKQAGYKVAGADQKFSPPMSTYLETQDIELFDLNKVDEKLIQKYDLIVVGNSVPRTSEHAKFIESCGVPFTSFPSFMGELVLKDKEVIGVAGTHGKTTTTYFITQMLEQMGEDPGYFIGGIMNGRPPARLGEGKFFIIESDEYDSAYFQKISKFRSYQINHLILTSLEFDHADIFNTIEDIKDEFRAVLEGFEGKIIANDDYQSIIELKREYNNNSWTIYGVNSEVGPRILETDKSKTIFELLISGRVERFETNVVGTHNILNISSGIILLSQLGFDTNRLQGSVASLKMVKRRQEERGYYKNTLVIDDFAHHPKAIDLTLDALKIKYPGKELITVFEPISATARSSRFQSEFTESLKKSNKVIIAANPLQTTVENSANLNCVQIADELNAQEIEATSVEDLENLRIAIDKMINPESVLVILSNRTCLGLWESDFVKELS